jgi:small subunit ribosomal protein S4
LQLREKQKGRSVYGLLERQFHNYYKQAVKRHGVSGENLLRTLELRLDSTIFRLGFADSRAQARQIVMHGHITVNGRKSGIPSHVLKVGDEVGLTSRGARSEYFKIVKENLGSKEVAPWLSVDAANLKGRVVTLPELEEIGAKFNQATIVEYYSR